MFLLLCRNSLSSFVLNLLVCFGLAGRHPAPAGLACGRGSRDLAVLPEGPPGGCCGAPPGRAHDDRLYHRDGELLGRRDRRLRAALRARIPPAAGCAQRRDDPAQRPREPAARDALKNGWRCWRPGRRAIPPIASKPSSTACGPRCSGAVASSCRWSRPTAPAIASIGFVKPGSRRSLPSMCRREPIIRGKSARRCEPALASGQAGWVRGRRVQRMGELAADRVFRRVWR